MILVLDIGNSNIVLGVFQEERLIHHWRIETDRRKTEDEYGMQVKALFSHVRISFDQIKGIIITSVVHPLCFLLNPCVRNILA